MRDFLKPKIDLFQAGKLVGSPRMIVKEGESASNTQGERTILAMPQILAQDGQPAKITQSSTKPGEEEFALSVNAKRTTP
jgi:type II secretory pathway component HofQ